MVSPDKRVLSLARRLHQHGISVGSPRMQQCVVHWPTIVLHCAVQVMFGMLLVLDACLGNRFAGADLIDERFKVLDSNLECDIRYVQVVDRASKGNELHTSSKVSPNSVSISKRPVVATRVSTGCMKTSLAARVYWL